MEGGPSIHIEHSLYASLRGINRGMSDNLYRAKPGNLSTWDIASHCDRVQDITLSPFRHVNLVFIIRTWPVSVRFAFRIARNL